MRIFQKADGTVNVSAREYDIAANTAIKIGQVVKLVAGLIVAATATETGAIIGIAAEDHKGAADALNPRANGTKILVHDCPDAIFACKAPVVTATGGSATTMTTDDLGAYSADDFNGGYAKLIKKGTGSTNTDPIGKVKRITDYAYTSTGTVSTFTFESGATACEGDEYEIFPPIGLAKGALDTGITHFVLSGVTAVCLRVVGRDEDRDEIHLLAAKHTLANNV